MNYRIMNRKLDAYSLEGVSCIKYYDENKDRYINPKYNCYGDVLVQTKRVFCGITLRFKVFFKHHWYWKPNFHWKHGLYYFHWLFFMFWYEREYKDVFDKIIKDHLGELEASKKTKPSKSIF